MNAMNKIMLALVIAALSLAAWMFRYEPITTQADFFGCYLLDRWTGDVYRVTPKGVSRVY